MIPFKGHPSIGGSAGQALLVHWPYEGLASEQIGEFLNKNKIEKLPSGKLTLLIGRNSHPLVLRVVGSSGRWFM